jgi:hypothetical protein
LEIFKPELKEKRSANARKQAKDQSHKFRRKGPFTASDAAAAAERLSKSLKDAVEILVDPAVNVPGREDVVHLCRDLKDVLGHFISVAQDS